MRIVGIARAAALGLAGAMAVFAHFLQIHRPDVGSGDERIDVTGLVLYDALCSDGRWQTIRTGGR